MIIENTELENILTSLLQKKITLEIEGKTLKTGKLILFSQKYFFLVLILINPLKKKQEKVEIPIPFNFKRKNNQIIFDYKITTLIQNNKEILKDIQNLKFVKNKFFNKLLTIHTSNEQ